MVADVCGIFLLIVVAVRVLPMGADYDGESIYQDAGELHRDDGPKAETGGEKGGCPD